jgi:uncharacterized RDD family membrane protein YckC
MIATGHELPSASFGRRMLAIGYDSLLLFGVLFVAAIPLTLLPEAFKATAGVRLAVQAYLLLVCAGFYTWFWVHGGQTLGMRAWRLRLVSRDGGPVSGGQAFTRFLAALLSLICAGAGFLWALVDPEGLAWHDRLSRTRLSVEPKARRGDAGVTIPPRSEAPQRAAADCSKPANRRARPPPGTKLEPWP